MPALFGGEDSSPSAEGFCRLEEVFFLTATLVPIFSLNLIPVQMCLDVQDPEGSWETVKGQPA